MSSFPGFKGKFMRGMPPFTAATDVTPKGHRRPFFSALVLLPIHDAIRAFSFPVCLCVLNVYTERQSSSSFLPNTQRRGGQEE